VSEQQDVIGDLEATLVLAGVQWAYRSASTRTLETYVEADGHDAAWFGNTRFTLFRDRLDRVFTCRRYAQRVGSSITANLDLLYSELSELDRSAMPRLAPGLVRRADLNGSPGWACQSCRFLLASCAFGRLDSLPWPQKSPTKQRVARQPDPESLQGTLFDGLADDEFAGLIALAAATHQLDMETFVVAHTLDPFSQSMELVFGRPRLNSGGGDAWHWYQDLLAMPLGDGGQPVVGSPLPQLPDAAPDAPVRLRRSPSERPGSRASGET
jgi:hypothetical protein